MFTEKTDLGGSGQADCPLRDAMPALRYVIPLACVVLLSGCHQFGYLVKRESELNCPTDIRQTVPWCAGEDAIFRCPCGPSHDFYGHKPTCWGIWPAPGAQWRDAYCGPLQRDYADEIPLPAPLLIPHTDPKTGAEPTEDVEDLPNPDSFPAQDKEPDADAARFNLPSSNTASRDRQVSSQSRSRRRQAIPRVYQTTAKSRRTLAPRRSKRTSSNVGGRQQAKETRQPTMGTTAPRKAREMRRRVVKPHDQEDTSLKAVQQAAFTERPTRPPSARHVAPLQPWSPTFIR